VEAILDVEASSALTDVQKKRVIAKAGPTLRAVAQDERSQWRNRELAVERLIEQLREALKVQRRRIATKPTRASRERRLESKKRRSTTKQLRRRPPD
jgi:ribosome-associated protein